MYVIILSFLG